MRARSCLAEDRLYAINDLENTPVEFLEPLKRHTSRRGAYIPENLGCGRNGVLQLIEELSQLLGLGLRNSGLTWQASCSNWQRIFVHTDRSYADPAKFPIAPGAARSLASASRMEAYETTTRTRPRL